jgi:hypothetical protein
MHFDDSIAAGRVVLFSEQSLLLPTARLTAKMPISKLHNLLYNKDFYTASIFIIIF